MYSLAYLISLKALHPKSHLEAQGLITPRYGGGPLVTSHWTPIVLPSTDPSNPLALFFPFGTLHMGIFDKAAALSLISLSIPQKQTFEDLVTS